MACLNEPSIITGILTREARGSVSEGDTRKETEVREMSLLEGGHGPRSVGGLEKLENSRQ